MESVKTNGNNQAGMVASTSKNDNLLNMHNDVCNIRDHVASLHIRLGAASFPCENIKKEESCQDTSSLAGLIVYLPVAVSALCKEINGLLDEIEASLT